MHMVQAEIRKRGRPRAFNENIESKTVQSLDKALVILKAVSEGDGLSLTDLSTITAITSPTVYRALSTMQQHGIVHFDEAAQLWSIGSGAFRIGNSFLRKTNIIEQSRPVMQQLMRETKETSNLGMLNDSDVIFLSQVETHEPIRAFHRPGSKGAVYASGIGKVLFAYMDDDAARRMLSRTQMEKFTDRTMTDINALITHKAEMRNAGYSYDNEERTLGMRCIAAPIFNAYGEAVAAISVSGPTSRITEGDVAELADIVKRSAATITDNIGGQPPTTDRQ
ncbi:MAG: HTH-type transcriptional regulator BhcR [Pseudomonadota bacterium]